MVELIIIIICLIYNVVIYTASNLKKMKELWIFYLI